MNNEELRYFAIDIAWQLYGTPYIWGGDDAVKGFDCSGLIVELLQSVGKLPLKGDWTAAMLWDRFAANEVWNPDAGCLVFWETSQGHIRHVELALGSGLSIGASGGGSRVRSRADAIEYNAFVKIRPIEGRGIVKGFLDPFRGD